MNMRGATGGARLRPRPSFSLRQLVRHAERGDGETFAFIEYTTFIWIILLGGLIFAMLGFWRVGASYSNDYGVGVGTLYTDRTKGSDKQNREFSLFTGNALSGSSTFAPAYNQRMWTGGINNATNELVFGYQINSQTKTRSERFFPGQYVCAVGEPSCYE